MSSFLDGFGSIVDIGGSIADEFAPDEVDDGIAGDWQRVGEDLIHAAEQLGETEPSRPE